MSEIKPIIIYVKGKKTIGFYSKFLNMVILPDDIGEWGGIGKIIYDHEVKHFINNNEKKKSISRLMFDVKLDWRDRYKVYTNLDLNYNLFKFGRSRKHDTFYMMFYILLTLPTIIFKLIGYINIIRYFYNIRKK